MERLTKRIDGRLVFPSELIGVMMTPSNDTMFQILTRLAAYEDTGLEPEDLKKAFNETAILKLAAQVLRTTPDHLRDLLQAEQDGRMAVLPVKKGTKIFRVVDIPEHKCQGRMRGHYFHSTKRIYKGVMQWEDGSDFGKTVFLTREEAEAAMAQKGGEG